MDSSPENSQNQQNSFGDPKVSISDIDLSPSAIDDKKGINKTPIISKRDALEPLDKNSQYSKSSRTIHKDGINVGASFTQMNLGLNTLMLTTSSFNDQNSRNSNSSRISKRTRTVKQQASKSIALMSKKQHKNSDSFFALTIGDTLGTQLRSKSEEKKRQQIEFQFEDDGAKTTEYLQDQIGSSLTINNHKKDNVKVCIRVRPLIEREERGVGIIKCVQTDNGVVKLDRGSDIKKFTFDIVANQQVNQETIFNQIAKPITDTCLQGYNGTIFAYGQTGAGKTYTIQGPQFDNDHQYINNKFDLISQKSDKEEQRGIIPRSFKYIFDYIENQKKQVEEKADGSELQFLIKCSYLEIYNDQILDLFEPSSVNLHVREGIKQGIYVEGLQEEIVNNLQEVTQLLKQGKKNRHVASTQMNRESSRSHSVLTTIIESKSMSRQGLWNLKISKFSIIDLAGSERSKNTDTMGLQLKEAGMINRSLSALGNVINSLVDIYEGKNRHVPYRDSKLTFILRDSLGGNSKTVIIANISPSKLNLGETLSTLEFAKRAKQIKNKAIINEDSSGTITVLKNELKRIKNDMINQNTNYISLISENQLLKQENSEKEYICKICKHKELQYSQIDKLDEKEEKLEQKEEEQEGTISSVSFDPLNSSNNSTPTRNNNNSEMKVLIKKYASRIKHLESLLSSNLEKLANQQSYFEHKISNHETIQEELNIAYNEVMQQLSREKMKLKLRDQKIAKLEQGIPLDTNENIINLQMEIRLLNDQLQLEKNQNINPKILKLQAEKRKVIDIKNIIQRELEKETKDPQALYKQFNEQKILINQLNQYLQKKANLKDHDNITAQNQQLKYENEQLQTSQIQLNNKIKGLQEQYNNALTANKQAANQLMEQFKTHKTELQKVIQEKTKEKLQVDLQLITFKQEKVEQEEDHKMQVQVNNKLMSQIDEVMNQKDKCQQNNESLKQENMEYEKQLKIKKMRLRGLEERLDSDQINYQQQKNELEGKLNKEAQIFQMKNKMMDEISSKLRIQISQQLEMIQSKQNEKEELETNMKNQTEKFQYDVLKIKDLNENKTKLLQYDHNNSINQLKQNLDDQRNQINKLAIENNQLYVQNKDLQDSLIRIKKEISSCKSLIQQLKLINIQNDSKSKQTKKEFQEIQEVNKKNLKEMEKLENKIDNLIQNSQANINDLNQQNSNLQTQLNNKLSQIKKFQLEKEENQQIVAQYEIGYNKLNEQNLQLQNDFDCINGLQNELKGQLVKFEDETINQQQINKIKAKEIKDLKEKNEELEIQCEQSQQAFNSIYQEIENLNNSIYDLQKINQNLKDKEISLINKNNELQLQHQNEISSIQKINQEYSEIQSQLQIELENEKKKNESQQQQMNDLKQQFYDKLTKKQKHANDLLKESQQSNLQIDEMTKLVKKYRIEADHQVQEKEEMKMELVKYQFDLPLAQNELKEVRQQQEQKIRELEQVKSQNQENAKLIQQQKLELNDLTKTLQATQKDLEDSPHIYEDKIKNQLKELQDLQTKHRELENQTKKDTEVNELKLYQAEEQVQLLSSQNFVMKKEQEEAMKEMIKMHQQIEIAQENNEEQSKEIAQLKNFGNIKDSKTQETQKTIKLLRQANKQLENERSRLSAELVLHSYGVRNPTQNIQAQLKINEENRKLKDELFGLQDDIMNKNQLIQQLQSANSSMVLEFSSELQSSNEQGNDNDNTNSNQYQQLIGHIQAQNQIQSLCEQANVDFAIQGEESLQKAMKVISFIDSFLEQYVDSDIYQGVNNTMQSSNSQKITDMSKENLTKAARQMKQQFKFCQYQQPQLNSFRFTKEQQLNKSALKSGTLSHVGSSDNILSSLTIPVRTPARTNQSPRDLPSSNSAQPFQLQPRSSRSSSKLNAGGKYPNTVERAKNISTSINQLNISIGESKIGQRQKSQNKNAAEAIKKQKFSATQLSQGNPVARELIIGSKKTPIKQGGNPTAPTAGINVNKWQV